MRMSHRLRCLGFDKDCDGEPVMILKKPGRIVCCFWFVCFILREPAHGGPPSLDPDRDLPAGPDCVLSGSEGGNRVHETAIRASHRDAIPYRAGLSVLRHSVDAAPRRRDSKFEPTKHSCVANYIQSHFGEWHRSNRMQTSCCSWLSWRDVKHFCPKEKFSGRLPCKVLHISNFLTHN